MIFTSLSEMPHKTGSSWHICLVHYHEIGLKGKNRSVFERKLKENIVSSLGAIPHAQVTRISGRLLVTLDSWEETLVAAQIICRIPGVVRVSCGVRTIQELEVIYEESLWLLDKAEPFTTFKVKARRANTNYPIGSMELNTLIGAWLSERLVDKQVKMDAPDAVLHVELIEGSAFVYAHTFKGIGGLPVGTAGRVVSLLSAGLDSPVAAWRMMKRGATICALHFSGMPETSDASVHLVREIIDVLKPYGGIESLYVVAFGSYQREIAALVPSELRVIFYRRLMFAVANRLAEQVNAKALVTGESLGQVASQTLDNIRAVDCVANYPVLRPLIGTDKQEIIDQAIAIKTFDISSQKQEDCCTLFMPRHPETHAKLKVVERIAQDIPTDVWLDEIFESLEPAMTFSY